MDRKHGVSAVASSFTQRDLKGFYGDPTASPSVHQKKLFSMDNSSIKSEEVRQLRHPSSQLAIEAPVDSFSPLPPNRRPSNTSDGMRMSGGNESAGWTNVMQTGPSFGKTPQSFAMDQLKLNHTMSDLSRSLPRGNSTLSSMSNTSSANMDSLHNRSSSSHSSSRSVGGASFNYSSTISNVGGINKPNHGPPGLKDPKRINTVFSQSIPDIISELHPFDESLDLGINEPPPLMAAKKQSMSVYDSHQPQQHQSKLSVTVPSVDSTVIAPYSAMSLSFDPLHAQTTPSGSGGMSMGFHLDDNHHHTA
jgi:hypothetical protein